MIYIDSRIGSSELADLIDDSLLVRLDYGDIAFEGNGPDGKVQIGIERKKWGDLIGSFRSGRLVGRIGKYKGNVNDDSLDNFSNKSQIIGMLDCYHKVYLFCEGIIRENSKTGQINEWRHGKWKKVDYSTSESARNRFSYASVWKHLITLESKFNIALRSSWNPEETARMVEVLYEWWSKPWETHKSHLQHYSNIQTALLRPDKPSWPVQFAANLPGFGWDRAIKAEKHFKSVPAMICASEKEWREVKGFGKVLAKLAWEALHNYPL